MSKNRIKISNPTIQTRAQMETLVAEISGLINDQRKMTADMDAEIKAVKDDYEAELTALNKQLDLRMEAARAWAEANPSEFAGAKSIDMLQAVVGWRTGQPQPKPLSGWTWARVLEKLQSLKGKFACYIRVSEEVNKQQIVLDRELLTPEELRQIGVRIIQEEAFFVSPKLTEVPTRPTAQ